MYAVFIGYYVHATPILKSVACNPLIKVVTELQTRDPGFTERLSSLGNSLIFLASVLEDVLDGPGSYYMYSPSYP